MDEAFVPFGRILERMLSFRAPIVDEDASVRTYIERYEIESPLELNVFRDEKGALQIGSTPPLYYVDTSLRPSFHKISFSADLDRDPDAE